jgi:hypothetical protein
MPITWLTRWILLDTLQIPFFLLSVLFALGCRSTPLGKSHDKANRDNDEILKVLLSGIFLGLAIFTKIPLFTMIPLVGFLILMHCSSYRRLVVMGVWMIPTVLIPLIWPIDAISTGQYQNWLTNIDDQTHRTGFPLSVSIYDFFKKDTILSVLGMTGLIFAAIKRDFFILLLTIPYLVGVPLFHRICLNLSSYAPYNRILYSV